MYEYSYYYTCMYLYNYNCNYLYFKWITQIILKIYSNQYLIIEK